MNYRNIRRRAATANSHDRQGQPEEPAATGAFGGGRPMTLMDYQLLSPPTYTEAMKRIQELLSGGAEPTKELYECTSTYVQPLDETGADGREQVMLINRPYRVWKDGTGVWRAEYDPKRAVRVSQPLGGWILHYEGLEETLYPSITTKKRKEAEDKLGKRASYFFPAEVGLRNIVIESSEEFGPAAVFANYWSDDIRPKTGFPAFLKLTMNGNGVHHQNDNNGHIAAPNRQRQQPLEMTVLANDGNGQIIAADPKPDFQRFVDFACQLYKAGDMKNLGVVLENLSKIAGKAIKPV